jgi:hypothetical protein
MKTMKARVIACVVCLFLSFGCFAAEKDVPFLHSIQADNSTLEQVSGERYVLSVPVKDISSILVFSDRPKRVAYQLTPYEYAAFVHFKSDMLYEDLPDLVVSFWKEGKESLAFEVTGYHVAENVISYDLRLLIHRDKSKPFKTNTGRISIYLDR